MAFIVFQPDETTGIDTEISQYNPTINFALRSEFYAGRRSTGEYQRPLIKFDLSSVPATATILSATLTLRCTSEDTTLDVTFTLRRSLVEWFEGNKSGEVPTEDGSTWNYRNHNGSVAWSGGAGGGAGGDYVISSEAVGSFTVTASNTYVSCDVTSDVQAFIDGTWTNHGWWILPVSTGLGTRKEFASSSSATGDYRPKLVVEYTWPIEGESEGTSSVTGNIAGVGHLSGTASATVVVSGSLTGNGIFGSTAGEATTTGSLTGNLYLTGSSESTSIHVARLMGVYRMVGSAFGISSAESDSAFEGKLRGSSEGISSLTGTMWGKATGVVVPIGCNTLPLLYITDGFTKTNGQKNLLNFLSEGSGFKLKNWRPQISQYKEGGRFSNGPLSQGRRLRYRNFDNSIEVFELAATSLDQDDLILFQRELLAWQEAAADYWVSDYVVNPVYLVAKSARETNTRYAIIHMISVPELENPYTQPFFNISHAAMETITVRIERGHWLSTPPGKFDCVPVSSVRSWTISGWESGS